MLIAALAAFALSANRTRYRTCEQSVHCGRNRLVGSQGWTLIPGSSIISAKSYESVINDTQWDNVLSLRISFLTSGAVRIRIEPHCPEAFPRFDAAKEPTIVDQRELASTFDISAVEKATQTILKAGDKILTIESDPFLIIVSDKTGQRMTINPDDTAVFESAREPDRNPELFRPVDFLDTHDDIRNGPTAVAISVKFHAQGLRFSGLAAHTLPLTLGQTIGVSDPIRFFNVDLKDFEIGNGMSMYGAIPFLMARASDVSDGVFWCNPSETWVDIRTDRSNSARFISEGGYIDVFLYTGRPVQITDGFTRLTGRPQLIPGWALGYHQCRWGYLTVDEVRTVTAKLDEALVPHDALWLDLDHTDNRHYFTFHPENFKNPLEFEDELEANKRKLVVLVDPHYQRTPESRIYREASEQGLLLKDKAGAAEFVGWCWPGSSSWPDFLNPAAREWWEGLYAYTKFTTSRPNVHIWNDMNELSAFDAPEGTAPRDLLHFGGIEEREVHNIYGHLMISASYGGLVKRNPSHNDRPFILTRSFFAGSQKYAAAWTGDNTADWTFLRNSIPAVLSFGLCGMVYSGSDVGGFFGEADDNLLTRWHQIGAWLYPFFRNHAHHRANRREVYLLHGELAAVAREAIVDRYRHLPYWYGLARQANLTGEPMVRPLWWEFPEQRFIDIDDRAMLGRALFIVPFLAPEPQPVAVQFPAGVRWYSYATLAEVRSVETVVEFNCGRTAVFLRGGSIVPIKRTFRKAAGLMVRDPVSLVIGVDADGKAKGELYIDDQESFNFARGEFVLFEFELQGMRFEGRITGGNQAGEFTRGLETVVDLIRIAGLAVEPTKAVIRGRELPVEVSEGIVTISSAIRLNADFNIQFSIDRP
jgi:alpha 1,3-glucosidase